jgi:hypothetical protein
MHLQLPANQFFQLPFIQQLRGLKLTFVEDCPIVENIGHGFGFLQGINFNPTKVIIAGLT